MIICSICKTENDQYSNICRKCGSFLQNRIPNLDLFGTLWKMIENPRSAFRLIMLAEHKNYSLLLYSFYGITIIFAGIWYFRLGDLFGNILFLFFWTLLLGIPLGIFLCPVVSSFHWILSKIFGGKASFRTSVGITSYALMPIVLSLLFILPIELLTFGMYLFTSNPHPITIKPISYILLLGFNIILTIWAFILSFIGTSFGNQIPLWRSVFVITILYLLVLTGLIMGGEYILKLL